MYPWLYVLALFLNVVVHAANLVVDQTALENDTGLFFDAHNHNGGVIPPQGVVDAEKFIYGKSKLDLSDLKSFWSTITNSSVTQEAILTNSLFSNGTKNFLRCNDPMRFCSEHSDQKACEEKLNNGIEHLLTSTPLTSFSTAYGVRRNMTDMENLPGRASSIMRAHAFVFELARTKVDVVEMSRPSMGGYTEEGSTREFDKFTKLTTDLRSDNTSKENLRFKERLKELGYSVPRIKWLLMIHTTELGLSGDTKTATYANGQCSLVPFSDTLKTDPETGLYSVLVNFDDVVGVDVAGPESTCFTKDGMVRFKNLAETTYFASVAKQRERKHKGKLVVRAHVGEGYPLIKEPNLRDELGACSAIKFFPRVDEVFDRKATVPVHTVESRKNIALILDAIEEVKKQNPDIDDYIVFRLAHLTHIDDALAKRAKELGVTADVNLSSNIATGAYTVPYHVINDYLVFNGIGPVDAPDLLKTLLQRGASLGEIFGNHGLKWLLLHHVPTTLGSDGSGVEHVESMRAEYQMAKELIDFWNANDPEFAKQNVKIDELLGNQKVHYEAMGY